MRARARARTRSLADCVPDWIPPRNSPFPFWVRVSYYMTGRHVFFRACAGLMGALFGTIDELCVTPKLQVLHFMRYVNVLFGYKREQYELLLMVFNKACEDNNPAFDYIGPGGAAYLADAIQVDGTSLEGQRPRPDASRLSDYVLVLMFVFMILAAIFAEWMPAFGPMNGQITRAYVNSTTWPPRVMWDLYFWYGENVDPCYLLNPPWMKALSMASPLVFLTFYPMAIYAFAEGLDWIVKPAMLWCGAVLMTTITILFDYAFEPDPALQVRNWPLALFFYGIYIVVPVWILIRLAPNRPFGVSPAAKEQLLRIASYKGWKKYFEQRRASSS